MSLTDRFVSVFNRGLNNGRRGHDITIVSTHVRLTIRRELRVGFIPLLLSKRNVSINTRTSFLTKLTPNCFRRRKDHNQTNRLSVLRLQRFIVSRLTHLVLLGERFQVLVRVVTMNSSLLLTNNGLLGPFFFR